MKLKAQPICDLIKDFLEDNSLKEINQIINLNTSWKKIVGRTISNNTEIISIKNGIIAVKTSNPVCPDGRSMTGQCTTQYFNKRPKNTRHQWVTRFCVSAELS